MKGKGQLGQFALRGGEEKPSEGKGAAWAICPEDPHEA